MNIFVISHNTTDAHIEKERRKRQAEERKRKEKEAEEKRKAAERKKDMDRIKKELRAKREAERKAELEAERRRAAAAAAAQQRASLPAFTVETRRISQQKTTQPKDTPRPQPSRQIVEPKRAPAKTSTAPKPPGGKQVYISPNRLQPVGPQASLRKGPDRSQLVRHYTSASGANKALVSGPQRTNRKGPSAVQSKVSLSKGPQASLRQGAQCGLVHGHQRSTITGYQSPIMSAV
ncbi:Hypothetical predicted protein [Paramuricea clavata]|uniref:Uncharacterized protein n=1 Tax=Paramuricea clavata TaxID=317549 RepID=A0A6S7GWK4_PARCT|nr:Hypothetical predicted protein [Paramuricea clavata]